MGTHTEQEGTILSMTGFLDSRRGMCTLHTAQTAFNATTKHKLDEHTFPKSLLVKIVTRGMYIVAMPEPTTHTLK